MIAIISDVHGNYPALKRVLENIDEVGCEQIICLGDVAGYYCMINECIEELRGRNVINLLGNHDQYLIQGTGCPRSNSANRCIEFQSAILKEENREWLENSREYLTMGDINFIHGGWKDPIDEYLYSISLSYFSEIAGKFFFSGHTHVQTLVDFNEKVYCNPGSVGQPRDGDARASYAILDGENILLKRVKYDIDSIAKKMKNNGFESFFYENLYQGTRIGGKKSSVKIINE
ncbi:metallophosphoesterase family protein [Lysinibacillus capsici]|uniref:metallophosphoesterase family protein n=1 Tax=Lysinibacillus TaxID=400634 RepID=UPI00214B93AB|nr:MULTISPECIES: metallophosphoesterase family protein [Lysinibacillus]UUV25147.1 metallophosphatase family protein [Lysinibacillus sp. FN11]UYB48019.1 metallophosphatase family protein [Lysinibacillus capsici]